jgi:hypothetical protein
MRDSNRRRLAAEGARKISRHDQRLPGREYVRVEPERAEEKTAVLSISDHSTSEATRSGGNT